MSKRRNIKIKKSKINIYSKRKNKTKQTISLVITIVAACVLGVVGYGIGKPIFNYFNNKDAQSDVSDTSNSSDSVISSVENSSSESTSSLHETSEPEQTVKKAGSFVLPQEAALSVESLNSALAAAKEAGYASVVVTLKDDNGVLHYKSEIARIKNNEKINAGTLSAKQICEAIEKAGLTPTARINTLKDRSAPTNFGSFTLKNGVIWLDNTAEAGGKPWLCPFEEATVNYIAELAEELSAAGFKDIICANVTFPPLNGYDKDTWLVHLDLRNKEKRYNALWDVVDKAKSAAAKNGAKLWVEMSGVNLINPEKSSLDSEIANNPEKLKTIAIIVDYSPSAEVSGIYADAKAFAENVKAAANGAELAVLIKSGHKGAALADAERAFEEAGLTVYFES